jgi:hypothetical protein
MKCITKILCGIKKIPMDRPVVILYPTWLSSAALLTTVMAFAQSVMFSSSMLGASLGFVSPMIIYRKSWTLPWFGALFAYTGVVLFVLLTREISVSWVLGTYLVCMGLTVYAIRLTLAYYKKRFKNPQ